MRYQPLGKDFGPLNLAQVHWFITKIDELVEVRECSETVGLAREGSSGGSSLL